MNVDGVSALAVALMGGGLLFVWSGLHGASVTGSLRDLISGKQPAGSNANPIAGGAVTDAGGSAAPGAVGGTAGSNQAIARLLAAPYGWSTGQQWNDLVNLWNRESGWSNTAKNPSSGAYGIAQALPESKYPPAGQESGGSSASAQISWGLSYIQQRYGSPSAAWQHEVSAGWY